MTSRPEDPPSRPDDHPEVVAAIAGDDAALERLLRAAEPGLRRRISIHPRWRRSLSADDVLQVAWLEAFLRIPSLRTPTHAAFDAWLARIVDNNLRDAIRELDRAKRPDPRDRQTVGSRGESARTLLARVLDDGATAGGRAALAEEVARLRRAILRLPPTYQRVVEALDLAERPVAEVADELGRSRGAVHLLRSRAHDRLAELLRDESQ